MTLLYRSCLHSGPDNRCAAGDEDEFAAGSVGVSLSGTSTGRSSDRARRCCRASEQIERVRVALLRSRFDREELHDPTGPPATCRAETTATVGRIAKVTSEAALTVEVDHSTAKGAVVYPVPMVGADHASNPARGMSSAEKIVCRRWVEERMR